MPEVDLNDLADDLARKEGLSESLSSAQIREVIGLLGRRWRSQEISRTMLEMHAIFDRAGLQSAHAEEGDSDGE